VIECCVFGFLQNLLSKRESFCTFWLAVDIGSDNEFLMSLNKVESTGSVQ
jgi:hypothetical protein